MAVRTFPNKPAYVYIGDGDVRSVACIQDSTGRGVLTFGNRGHWDTRLENQPVQLLFNTPDDVTAIMEMLDVIRIEMEDKAAE